MHWQSPYILHMFRKQYLGYPSKVHHAIYSPLLLWLHVIFTKLYFTHFPFQILPQKFEQKVYVQIIILYIIYVGIINSLNVLFSVALKTGGILEMPKVLLDARRPISPTQETRSVFEGSFIFEHTFAYKCTVGSYVSLSDRPSVVTWPKFRLEVNSYLRKYSS